MVVSKSVVSNVPPKLNMTPLPLKFRDAPPNLHLYFMKGVELESNDAARNSERPQSAAQANAPAVP